jgi:hypothetical protein
MKEALQTIAITAVPPWLKTNWSNAPEQAPDYVNAWLCLQTVFIGQNPREQVPRLVHSGLSSVNSDSRNSPLWSEGPSIWPSKYGTNNRGSLVYGWRDTCPWREGQKACSTVPCLPLFSSNCCCELYAFPITVARRDK